MLNIDENIEKIILSVHNEQKLGAVRLEKIIESEYGIHIPHNTIHRVLLKNGKAREERSHEKSSFVCICITMMCKSRSLATVFILDLRGRVIEWLPTLRLNTLKQG